jgi:hypothetical protein
MTTTSTQYLACGLILFAGALALGGCEPEGSPRDTGAAKKPEAAAAAAQADSTKIPEAGSGKKVKVGKNVHIEVLEGGRRRVLVDATVCLREGQLELLLTKKHMKEHESILAADVDARDIHQALLASGAKEGSPMKFVEKNGQYEVILAKGPKIRVHVQYEEKGKTVIVPAQKWIRSLQAKKELDADWVFAGSLLIEDPEDKTKKPRYGANGGDVICISNFETALLDLPIRSSKENPDLLFEAHKERIPELNAKVVVILEPQAEPKKK